MGITSQRIQIKVKQNHDLTNLENTNEATQNNISVKLIICQLVVPCRGDGFWGLCGFRLGGHCVVSADFDIWACIMSIWTI